MLQIVDDVEISQEAIIPCPDVGFKPRRAQACQSCEHFRGIGLMCADESLPWHERYAVRCGHIIERRTQILPPVIET